MVGIVHKVKFISASSKKFKSYIDYIDRDEATRNYKFEDFSLYNDYMGNPNKSGSLFTSDKDMLTKIEKKKLKSDFEKAQENNSLMWQDVFSFDNEWLEKHGLYNKKTHVVDEEKIRNAVRSSMNELIKKEGFNNLVWSASLHYNTNNIHVHIASVEINPTRERGKRKPKTLTSMKSKFLNNLIDRQQDLDKINEIIRDNIIEGKRETHFLKDKEMKRLAIEIIKKLPEDKRQWHYNYNTLSDVKPNLDKLTKYYIENYKKVEFDSLLKQLDKEELFLKEAYGEGNKVLYKNYKQNKIDELYTRMGNTILKEIKEHVLTSEKIRNKTVINDNKYNAIIISNRDIKRMKKVFDDEFTNIKNQREYEKLQQHIQYENELNR